MEIKDILLIIFPFVSGVVSAWITYLFTIRIKKSENMLKFKEERYANLLTYLHGFGNNNKSGNDIRNLFFKEQYKSWLYASDDVVKSVNDFVTLIKNSNSIPTPKEEIGNIALQMRKDLLGKTELKKNDFEYTNVIE